METELEKHHNSDSHEYKTTNMSKKIVACCCSDYLTNKDSEESMQQSKLIDMDKVHDLYSKLDQVNHNLSEVSVKFHQLNGDITSCFESYSKKMSFLLDHFNNDISSKLDNFLEEIKQKRKVSFEGIRYKSAEADLSNGYQTVNENLNETDQQRKFLPPEKMLKRNSYTRQSLHSSVSSEKLSFQRIQKIDEAKEFLFNVIKESKYYKHNQLSEEELTDIVDASDIRNFKANDVIIAQGSAVTHYYIVGSGFVDVIKEGDVVSTASSKKVLIESYLVGSVSSCTFRAKTDCEIWFLSVDILRNISAYYKKKRLSLRIAFLKSVKMGGKPLGEIVNISEIEALSTTSRLVVYNEGDVIFKEGDKADVFYMIETGTVDVFQASCGTKPIKSLSIGDFFGERALLSDNGRHFTCIATSRLKCLIICRDDFSRILGDLEESINVNKERIDTVKKTSLIQKQPKISMKLSDLDIQCNLGFGTFSDVKFIKLKPEYTKSSVFPNTFYALKCISKETVTEVASDYLQTVLNAREAWKELSSQFILKLFTSFEDYNYMYYLLEYVEGGTDLDLYSILLDLKKFPEGYCKFYIASILLAFEEIHSKRIAIRDVKPENIILGLNGYIKLTKLRFAKKVDKGKTFTLAGTPEYLAPEVIKNEGHDWGVDYWATGVMLYEMMFGSSPFAAEFEMDLYRNIISGQIDFPSDTTVDLKGVIKGLCAIDQTKRMGRTKGGTKVVMEHSWLSDFSFESLKDNSMESPTIPQTLRKTNKSRNAHKRLSIYNKNNAATLAGGSILKKNQLINMNCHGRKKLNNMGKNRYIEQIKEIQQFQKKNLKHMIVKSSTVKKPKISSFSQFYLLSASPDDLARFTFEDTARKFIDPFFCKSIDVVDRYPQVPSIVDNVLTPVEIASICFPSGIKMRLIPGCLFEKEAERFIGEETDRYQLHTFTDSGGETQFGVSVTIREAVSNDIIENMQDLRLKCKSANIIKKFILKIKDSKTRKERNDVEKIISKLLKRGHSIDKKANSVESTYKTHIAKESYETMVENEKLGEVCIVEKCFIFIGTNPDEQSLMLCALKQLVELDRLAAISSVGCLKRYRDKAISKSDENNTTPLYNLENLKGNRHWMLHLIRTDLRLSPEQAKLKHPSDEYEYISRGIIRFEANPLLEDFPPISLPLPLPDMFGEYGVAKLFLTFNSSALLLTLNLLLLESSVLVVGTSHEDVACCASALLKLLKPFKWSSVFIPQIPIDYLDFVSSPVPFVAGLVVENSSILYDILKDDRIQDAVGHGMVILNLHSGDVISDHAHEKQKMLAFSQTLVIHQRIESYQKRLKFYSQDESSSLNNFTKFFQQGTSTQEGVTIQSLRRVIRNHLDTLFRFNFDDETQWTKYADYDEVSQSQIFDISKLCRHFKVQYKFLAAMSCTQLFVEFLRQKREPVLDQQLKDRSALFIADWLFFKWKRFRRTK